MRDYEYDLSQVYHHRFRVEEAAAELKAMRQAPPDSYLPKDIRGAELGYDFWRSRLRITEDILRRFHPDQPRVPAGNPDGGQWTDGAGRSGPATSDQLSPTKIDFSGAKPGISPGAAVKPMPTLKPGALFGRGAGPALGGQTLRQLLDSDPLNSSFKGTPDEATDRYNWLLQNAPKEWSFPYFASKWKVPAHCMAQFRQKQIWQLKMPARNLTTGLQPNMGLRST